MSADKISNSEDCSNILVPGLLGGEKSVTWGYGNELFVYNRTEDHNQDKSSSPLDRCVHNVRWNTSLYHPIVRKLANESHNIFVQLQKQKNLAANDQIKFSHRYRSVLKACVLDIYQNIGACYSENEKREMEHHLTTLDMTELVWSLCEILFIDIVPGGVVLTRLLDWQRVHFTEVNQTVKTVMSSESPDQHSDYWPCVNRLLLQGRIEEVRQMLTAHSHRSRDQFRIMDEMLRSMPLFSNFPRNDLSAFDTRWSHWHEKCCHQLENTEFDAELKTLCNILTGNDETFVELKDLCETWFCFMISYLLYKNPSVKPIDLQYHTQFAIQTFGGMSSIHSSWDNILLAAIEFDIHQVLKESSASSSNWWFPAHFTDLLHHCGKLDSQKLFFGASLREFLLLEYGSNLMSHQSLWQIGIGYLDSCDEFGRHFITEFIDHIPIETERKAEKILKICESRDMKEQIRCICKTMGMQALQNSRLGPALTWALRSKDVPFITHLAERFLTDYTDKGGFTNRELIDNLGASILLSTKLTFLGKYQEFHKLHEEGDFKTAATLLLSLLTSKTAPKKFWTTLLTDALPLLECEKVVFSTDQTYDLMHCLEELQTHRKLNPSEQMTTSEKSERLEAERVELLRVALARNLARAIIQEGNSNLA